VHPWAAIVCGAVGATVQQGASAWLLRCQVDDPLDAVSVHAACGAWGCLWLGLVAERDFLVEVYGSAVSTPFGAFRGGGGELLACQVTRRGSCS
jgi:Amt family ammonium transporter